MKRRDFILKTTGGIVAIGAAGCSDDEKNPVVPDTKGDSIPTTKLGKTDITVSKFAFGSHILPGNVNNTAEREYMIRDAYEKGVTTFDIYNKEGGAYQYEPMSIYLTPILYDVVISVKMKPEGSRTFEEQFFYNLELFKRDYLDMVRIRADKPGNDEWNFLERLFELRDEGYLRAVGAAVHKPEEMNEVIEAYGDEIDYICFPYNFYHNKWKGSANGSITDEEDFDPLIQLLHNKGIGIVTIKPFTGDYLVQTLKEAAKVVNPEISYSQACLRYIINSDLNPDTTFAGMNYLREFDENIKAFYNPEITEEETALLNQLRDVAQKTAHLLLPDHYKFLNDWAPKPDISENYKLG